MARRAKGQVGWGKGEEHLVTRGQVERYVTHRVGKSEELLREEGESRVALLKRDLARQERRVAELERRLVEEIDPRLARQELPFWRRWFGGGGEHASP